MSSRSVATLRDPEFLNITSISPLVSKCEIKVLYVGGNRNRSFISKEVATRMAETLPGCPIVGYYIESKEDFGDHGDQMIIDGEGIKFKSLTKPYGFVAPDSKIWFQEFEDVDEFGNTCIREYLMTEGYLWTGQFEECQRVLNKGNGQSMELDKNSLKGHWSTDANKGIEFFIINDAVLSKLCILGEDVEPCFEGASVTSPNVSSNFSKDEGFIPSLFTMMEQLKDTLKEGGKDMDALELNKTEDVVEAEPTVEPIVEEVEAPSTEENFSESQDNIDEPITDENQIKVEEFKKNEDTEEEKKDDQSSEEAPKSEDPVSDDQSEKDKKDEEDKKKYELLESEYSELKEKYSLLEQEVTELRSFKASIDDEKKDEMINSFCMLSDEDKKDVIENKSKYTLDEIESKLSVICVRKKVNFDLSSDNTNKEEVPTTFSLDSLEDNVGLPAWLKAVEENSKE